MDRIWNHELPGVAAREEDLIHVEGLLAEKLDDRYRSFLAHANGWHAFYQWVDLFGTKDLLGETGNAARERLGTLERKGVLSMLGFKAADAVPIGMTRALVESEDVDLFVIIKPQREAAGQVHWLSGEEVDRFPSFDSFFLAMLDYNREEVNHLLKEAKTRGRLM